MKYITGQFALNLPCSLETCGDWHTSALRWDRVRMAESEGTIWGDYGIERNVSVPNHRKKYCVANHIRALLDLLYDGNFALAQGMNRDFICNDKYDEEIFEQVNILNRQDNWKDVDSFMHKEYGRKWRLWKNGRNNTGA